MRCRQSSPRTRDLSHLRHTTAALSSPTAKFDHHVSANWRPSHATTCFCVASPNSSCDNNVYTSFLFLNVTPITPIPRSNPLKYKLCKRRIMQRIATNDYLLPQFCRSKTAQSPVIDIENASLRPMSPRIRYPLLCYPTFLTSLHFSPCR